MSEARIVINGTIMTNAQSMTIRVALESFSEDCSHLLDDGEIFKSYMNRIEEIRDSLYE